jgi:hypothetical protein
VLEYSGEGKLPFTCTRFLKQGFIAAIYGYNLQIINNAVVIRECRSFAFCPFLSPGT